MNLQTSINGAPVKTSARRLSIPQISCSIIVMVVLLAISLWLGANPDVDPRLQLSLIFGSLFGIALQRSRFCFQCLWRDWLDRRDPRGLLGVLVALSVGLAGYTLVFGAWLPDPSGQRLPPNAFIGPVSLALVMAGLAFGAGMAISGSCLSAHLYRLGEGSSTAPFALLGSVLGFVLGFASWNSLYLLWIADAQVIWAPRHLGYAGSVLLPLSLICAASFYLLRFMPTHGETHKQGRVWNAVFIERWPGWLGGAFVGAVGVASYFRLGPLGVTAEIASRSRSLATATGIAPARLEGLDTLRGCVAIVSEAAFSTNGVFVLGLVAASFAAALAGGAFQPRWPKVNEIARGLLGGVLLGWGSVIGLGCTVGTLLSGIMAGAASGWVFAFTVAAGSAFTTYAGRRFGVLARR